MGMCWLHGNDLPRVAGIEGKGRMNSISVELSLYHFVHLHGE